jgi:hypothetical protein
MLPHLFANWRQVFSLVDLDYRHPVVRGNYQPVFVLQKAESEDQLVK